MTETHRTFICIDMPHEIIEDVARIQSALEGKFLGKPTELENLHLTLKFLGEIAEEKIEKVKQALEKISHEKLQLKAEKIGVFQRKSTPKIVWVKITGGVHALQKKIDESISDLFEKESRFMAHMTIARVKKVKSKQTFLEYLSSINPKKNTFPVNSFKLKTSVLKPEGPTYTTLAEYSLA